MSVPSFPIDLGDGYRLLLETWSDNGSMMQVVVYFGGNIVMRFPFEIKGKQSRDDRELAAQIDAAKREAAKDKKTRDASAAFAARHNS